MKLQRDREKLMKEARSARVKVYTDEIYQWLLPPADPDGTRDTRRIRRICDNNLDHFDVSAQYFGDQLEEHLDAVKQAFRRIAKEFLVAKDPKDGAYFEIGKGERERSIRLILRITGQVAGNLQKIKSAEEATGVTEDGKLQQQKAKITLKVDAKWDIAGPKPIEPPPSWRRKD